MHVNVQSDGAQGPLQKLKAIDCSNKGNLKCQSPRASRLNWVLQRAPQLCATSQTPAKLVCTSLLLPHVPESPRCGLCTMWAEQGHTHSKHHPQASQDNWISYQGGLNLASLKVHRQVLASLHPTLGYQWDRDRRWEANAPCTGQQPLAVGRGHTAADD